MYKKNILPGNTYFDIIGAEYTYFEKFYTGKKTLLEEDYRHNIEFIERLKMLPPKAENEAQINVRIKSLLDENEKIKKELTL